MARHDVTRSDMYFVFWHTLDESGWFVTHSCELSVVKGLFKTAVHRQRNQQQLMFVLQMLA